MLKHVFAGTLLRNALFAALAVILCAAPAMAAEQDFTVHNHTGRIMKALYVAPSSSDSWGDDIMGSDVLDDGADVNVKFDRTESECTWDVRGEFEDGTYAEVKAVDLCTVTDVTFNA